MELRKTPDGVAYGVAGPDRTDRPLLLFVHGGMHASWCWSGFQSWFAERGWRSAALDWYQHGRSAPLSTEQFLDRSITDVGHEIGAVLADLDATKPVLVGHSMGGLAALCYAAARPAGSLTALGLLAPVVPEGFGEAPIELPVDFERPSAPPPPELGRQLFYSGVSDRRAEEIYPLLVPESPRAVWEATRWTVPVDLGGIDIPAYLVTAEHDMLVPSAYVETLAAALGAPCLRIAGRGHGLTVDPGWDENAAGLEDWLLAGPVAATQHRASTAPVADDLVGATTAKRGHLGGRP